MPKRRLAPTIALLAAAAAAQGAASDVFDLDGRLGGPATVRDASLHAFGFPAPVLDRAERRAFAVGNSFFRRNWTSPPGAETGRQGLGPLFNARSCSACHLRDGRSRPPDDDDVERSGLLLRIGVRDAAGGPDAPHPLYGVQLQDLAAPGLAPEGRAEIAVENRPGAYGDGEPYVLAAPRYRVGAPSRGALGDGVVLGPRVAPALIGLGLLEAIPESVLARRADPDDRDGDGISGRVHWLGDGAERRAGRFGWKATQPTVELQTAAAFVHDMGVTSPRFPLEPPGDGGDPVSPRNATSGEATPEIDAGKLDRVVFYTRMLAVPAARDAAVPEVRRGAARFESFGCAACHTPSVETGDDAIHPAYRRVRIRPYTDLLLHDLGPDLADEKTDGDARPSEWRTPPLWGVGLTSTVSGHTRFLHDGRARNLAEAVLWHGGEAEAARERFRRAEKSDRAALLRFLESL